MSGAGLTSPTGHASHPAYRLDGLVAADHYVDVPLDHQDPSRGTHDGLRPRAA